MKEDQEIQTYIKEANNGMKEKMPGVRKAVKIYERKLNMKEQTLISMVKFTLTQDIKKAKRYSDLTDNLMSIFKYSEFMTKQLTLGMFIPCDLEGNVLEDPNINDGYETDPEGVSDNFNNKEKAFEEAEERVLFKGCIMEVTPAEYCVKFGKEWIYSAGGVHGVNTGYFRFKTIEDLVPLNLILTESAIKTIEG